MKRASQHPDSGFTLIELVIVAALISMVTAWSFPTLQRKARQEEVDRYTQTIETGVFSLRSRLGTTRSSCTLSFSNSNTFLPPSELVEFQQPDGNQAGNQRIECCNSGFEKFNVGGCLTNLDADLPRTYRLVQREGSSESNAVNVAVSTTMFTMTSPGTSAETNSLTIRIRSRKQNDAAVLKSDGSSRLITRCIQVSGTGSILRGNWDDQLATCLAS